MILAAWFVAGTLDILAAVTYYPLASGVRVTTLLQGIASGILGDRAFAGGVGTAILGLILHYTIALIWTILFVLVFRRVRKIFANLFAIGIVYGVVVWFVMNLIVLPLSNVSQGPFSLLQATVDAVILMSCVGLPIAMIVGRDHRI